MRKKSKHPQINKTRESSKLLDLPTKSAQRSPARRPEKILDNTSNPYGKIKISIKVNAWIFIKASNMVTVVSTSTFCFLHNFRD